MKTYELVTHDDEGQPTFVIELPDHVKTSIANTLTDYISWIIRSSNGTIAGGLSLKEIKDVPQENE